MFKNIPTGFSLAATSQRRLFYFLLFLGVFSYFLWLNSAPVFPDPDSFYHAKIIQLINNHGPLKIFPWLPFTTLNDIYIDHHFLYHLLLAPLVKFFNPLLVVKLAAVFFATLAVVIFQWLLDRLEIKYSFLYTLILLLSDKFIFRLNLAKVPSLSLIFLLLALYFIFKRPAGWNWPLFCLSFFYVWLYGGWPIFLGLGAIYFIITGVSKQLEEIKKQKTNQQASPASLSKVTLDQVGQNSKLFLVNLFSRQVFLLPLSLFSGLLAGLIINPYFPKNLHFYWQQTIQIGLVNYRHLVDVGGEWYPFDVGALIGHNIYGAILFVIALILFFIFLNRQRRFTWLLFFLSIIFLGLTLKSQRNIEYFVPLALIFSALVFTATWPQLRPLFLGFIPSHRRLVIVILFFLVLCLPIIFSYNFRDLKRALRQGFNFSYLAGAGAWLNAHTSPGAVIYHDNWGDFPNLFYRASAQRYLVGLDPTFMYFKNPEQYKLWRALGQGQKGEASCRLAAETFDSHYLFVQLNNKKLISALALDPHCVKVYEDADGLIYRADYIPTPARQY